MHRLTREAKIGYLFLLPSIAVFLCFVLYPFIYTIVLSFFTLFIGGGLYLLCRSERLVMFDWCKTIGIYPFIQQLRSKGNFDSWLVYSLPDGLWLFSYIILMGAIWAFDMRKSLLCSVPMIIIAIGSELLQFPHIVRGTFDMMDLLCYAIGSVSGLFYIKNLNKNNDYENKKSI